VVIGWMGMLALEHGRQASAATGASRSDASAAAARREAGGASSSSGSDAAGEPPKVKVMEPSGPTERGKIFSGDGRSGSSSNDAGPRRDAATPFTAAPTLNGESDAIHKRTRIGCGGRPAPQRPIARTRGPAHFLTRA
jgi:hypothetical protein